jgi:hypothetical protein
MWFSLMPQHAFGQDDSEFPCNGLPYNIDVNCDGFINFTDLTAFLPFWGENFTPDLNCQMNFNTCSSKTIRFI